MKKRLTSSFLLAVLLVSLLCGTALAFLYRAPVSISENTSSSYTMLPVLWTQNNTWLAANGFMSSSASDTRVQTLGGLNRPWLVADNKTLTAIPVEADSQNNLYFVTGESAASAMNIILGYNGYITRGDDADLEPGNNFSIDISGYFDTDAGASKNYASKGSNLVVSANATNDGVIQAALTASSIANFTDFTEVDASGKLTVTSTRITGVDVDRDEDVYVYYDYGASYFDDLNWYFTLYMSSASLLNGFGGVALANLVGDMNDFGTTEVNVHIRRDGAAYNLYLDRGDLTATDVYTAAANTPYYLLVTRPAGGDTVTAKIYSDAARTALLDTLTVAGFGATKWRYAYGFINYNIPLAGADWDGYVENMRFSAATTTTTTSQSTGRASGEYVVSVSDNTTHLNLSIDSVLEDSVAFIVPWEASVPDTSDNWTFMQNNSMPYADNITLSVGGVRQLLYAPNTMIIGTNLPDREATGGSENGTIVWGANPAGIAVSLGSMSSSGQPEIGSASDTSTSDILPLVGGTDWRPDATVSATLLANPMRPIVTAISDNTTLSEYQVWVWFGIIFVVFITVLAGANVRGHHLITGVAASAAIILMVVWTVFPLLSLLIVILAIWGGLVSERSPSL